MPAPRLRRSTKLVHCITVRQASTGWLAGTQWLPPFVLVGGCSPLACRTAAAACSRKAAGPQSVFASHCVCEKKFACGAPVAAPGRSGGRRGECRTVSRTMQRCCEAACLRCLLLTITRRFLPWQRTANSIIHTWAYAIGLSFISRTHYSFVGRHDCFSQITADHCAVSYCRRANFWYRVFAHVRNAGFLF